MKTKDIFIDSIERHLPKVLDLKRSAINYGLEGIDVFDKFTDDELVVIFNYIGPNRWPKWIRYLYSYFNVITLEAVLIHDCDFECGGTKDDFHLANIRLRNNLTKLNKIHRDSMCWLRYKYNKLRIKIAYRIVESNIGFRGWNLKIKE